MWDFSLHEFYFKESLNISQATTGISSPLFTSTSYITWYSSRQFFSQNNQQQDIATLIIDVLDDSQSHQVFFYDTTQLSNELIATNRWLKGYSQFKEVHLGYLGTDMGVAVAFKAASQLHDDIETVILVSGGLDLAHKEIKLVQRPSLLVAGEILCLNSNCQPTWR